MSKVSFRARALDATKPLPIYHADDLPDIAEYTAINRTVPQMPTGMEKEEESERHLQEVILSQQLNNSRNQAYIPTPEASITISHYRDVYHLMYAQPSQYVRVPGLSLEEEVPDYDLDLEDEEWLNAQTNEWPLSPTDFERMMDKLEKGSGNTVLSVREAQLLLKDDEDLVLAVYDYWLAKRLRLGRALIPTVRQERRDGSASNNPYMAFRKRTEKMQTRKNRKNDEMAYMQMLKLKRDLARASSLAEMVKERESKKHELARGQMNVFKKRFILEDWSGSIVSSLRPVATRSASSKQATMASEGAWDGRTILVNKMDDEDDIHHIGRHEVLVSSGLKRKRKKKYYYTTDTPEPKAALPSTPEVIVTKELSAEKSDDEEPDGMFTFRRKAHVKYYAPRDSLGTWPWYEDETMEQEEEGRDYRVPRSKKYRFSRTTVSGSSIGLARRRLGRGGRLAWDRVVPRDRRDRQTGEESSCVAMDVSSGYPEDQEGREKEEESLHFLSRSPTPTSDFDFQHLSFVELPGNTHPHTTATVPHHQRGTTSSIPFGGFHSDSTDTQALSFSSLPTSQFSLKPSSSDDKSTAEHLEPPGRSWSPPDNTIVSAATKMALDEKAEDSTKKPINDHTYIPDKSLPDMNTQIPSHGLTRQSAQQVDHKEMNRTSLSVTEAKTIIYLSNASTDPKQLAKTTAKNQLQNKGDISKPVNTTTATKPIGEYKQIKVPPNGPLAVPPPSNLPVATSSGTSTGEKEEAIDPWSRNRPAANILQLNSPLNSLHNYPKRSNCVCATADAALLITSQFLQHHIKEENPEPPPSQPRLPKELAIPVSSVVDKRTNIPTIPLPLVARRPSSTNGSSYPELFNSTTRRLSETERGLKQALAGSVLSHNSLIETTTNSLVQLGNSEVT